jgi:hypothetical protein
MPPPPLQWSAASAPPLSPIKGAQAPHHPHITVTSSPSHFPHSWAPPPSPPLLNPLPPLRCPSTASRPAVTPPLSSPALPSPPPPLGRSSQAPDWLEAELRWAPTHGNGHRTTVDQSPRGPQPCGPSPRIFFLSKNNPEKTICRFFSGNLQKSP